MTAARSSRSRQGSRSSTPARDSPTIQPDARVVGHPTEPNGLLAASQRAELGAGWNARLARFIPRCVRTAVGRHCCPSLLVATSQCTAPAVSTRCEAATSRKQGTQKRWAGSGGSGPLLDSTRGFLVPDPRSRPLTTLRSCLPGKRHVSWDPHAASPHRRKAPLPPSRARRPWRRWTAP